MLNQGRKCFRDGVTLDQGRKCHQGRKCYIKVEYCLIKIENVINVEGRQRMIKPYNFIEVENVVTVEKAIKVKEILLLRH